MLSASCRYATFVLLVVSSLELSGCAGSDRSRSLESTSNRIYLHGQWSQEYEEVGNQEMSNYHKEMADKERDEYTRESTDLFDLFLTAIFDALFDGSKE
jgi:hypothetical protein